jgi:peroxiredoxin
MRPLPTCIALCLALLSACTSAPVLSDIALADEHGMQTTLPLGATRFTVVYFLSPQCPLCISYVGSFKALSARFADEGVTFVGVFSGPWTDRSEIAAYKRRHTLEFAMLRDPELRLAHALQATVTPEAFLLDSIGNVLYAGSIDNWVNALGKKKQEVTHHHLADAISAALEGRPISPRRTTAIGCLIE